MAVFFQNIPDDHFDVESDFIVKESKSMQLVIGLFFLLFSLGVLSMSMLAGGVILISAIGILVKSSKDQIIMKINREGIYYYGQLLTDWNHFISSEFIDELPLPSYNTDGINDQFFLMIKYYKDHLPGHYGRKIQLTNTQDKSEEEIIAAIHFYYKNSQEKVAD
ncbi:MAG TPA: hypothetical protein VL095_06930 [Flavisolibacter sp.]|nr:hypothetical protein [Flavisolibacter sp.]